MAPAVHGHQGEMDHAAVEAQQNNLVTSHVSTD
jgi:hypothetical protein